MSRLAWESDSWPPWTKLLAAPCLAHSNLQWQEYNSIDYSRTFSFSGEWSGGGSKMTACLILDSGLNGSVALWLWEADDLSALASYLCLKGERGLGVRASSGRAVGA